TGAIFGVGHQGKVRHVALRQAAGAPLGAVQTAIATVKDASPELIDTTITLGVGAPPIGVDVADDSAVAAATSPKLTGSNITSAATTGQNAIGIRSAFTTGTPDVTFTGGQLSLFGLACPAVCRGI